MKALADALGVTPMALYHHVEHKGCARRPSSSEAAVKEQPLPVPGGTDWRQEPT